MRGMTGKTGVHTGQTGKTKISPTMCGNDRLSQMLGWENSSSGKLKRSHCGTTTVLGHANCSTSMSDGQPVLRLFWDFA